MVVCVCVCACVLACVRACDFLLHYVLYCIALPVNVVEVVACVDGCQVRRRVRLEGAELEEYRRQEKEKEMDAARVKQEHSRKYVLLMSTVCFYSILSALLSLQLFVSSKLVIRHL